MAKVFLDTNYFIDAIHRLPENNLVESLITHHAFVSTLSFHIYCYIFKIVIPNKKLIRQSEKFSITNLTQLIMQKSLTGPTHDLEDNIQLHSAAEADCDYFLTNDKNLLKLNYFGKTKIAVSLKKALD